MYIGWRQQGQVMPRDPWENGTAPQNEQELDIGLMYPV